MRIKMQQRRVQCTGTTAAGRRCKQRITVRWPLDQPFDESAETRCALHPKDC